MQTAITYTDRLFLVSGIDGGREAFLGRALGEPLGGFVTLEGKAVHLAAPGRMTVRPFSTRASFPVGDPGYAIHELACGEALDEARGFVADSAGQVDRAAFPLLYRWMESCVRGAPASAAEPGPAAGTSPLLGFYGGFAAGAEEFRRAMYECPRVASTTELDRVAELEGSLAMELGKLANQMAIKLGRIVARDDALASYLAAFRGLDLAARAGAPAGSMGGWVYVVGRMQIAKNRARWAGDVDLVREINALTKEGIAALNEAILDHCSSLDVLITEAFAQYEITPGLGRRAAPFDGYLHPQQSTFEAFGHAPPIRVAAAAAGP